MSTYLLIPGAWHAAWSWRPVAQRLRAAGHTAITLTMPGLDDGDDPAGLRLADAVEHVAAELVRRDLTDVTMVAHSWGGYPMTGAAHRLPGRISKLVYFAAFVPARGKSVVAENPPETAELLRSLIAASPDGAIPMKAEYLRTMLMPGASEQIHALLAELLVAQPGAYMTDSLDLPDVTTLGIPVAYIACEDEAVMPKPSAEFAARLGVAPVTVPGTHEALLTHPDDVAKAILAA